MDKQKYGKWEPYDYDIFGGRTSGYRCPFCGWEFGDFVFFNQYKRDRTYNFCPNCGADMRYQTPRRFTGRRDLEKEEGDGGGGPAG